MKRVNFKLQEAAIDYMSNNDTLNTVVVLDDNGWIKCDLDTNTKSAKVAVGRLFKVLPEFEEWKDIITEELSYGYKGKTEEGYVWRIDNSGENMYVYFSCKMY